MKKNFVILAIFSLLTACQSTPSGPSQADMAANINNLEKEIGAAGQPPPEKLDSLQNALIAYADAFPKDSVSVKNLAKAGETARLSRQFDKAMEIFDRIQKNYPDSREATTAMFLKAFTLDNDLKKFDEAKTAYEAFLAKYPTDEFADDAQFLLKNLGKSPEEIVKGFEKNAQ